VSALDRITARSQLAAGFVAPRSGDVTVAAAGLERMRRLVEALGNPQRAYRTIHVAGSKGKGSTVAYAAAILTATGRTTGRYTSPHLMDWRERIAVDGVDISEADFDRVVSYVDSTMVRLEVERPGGTPHNAIELLTAAAFVHFAEVGCEAAVIEVGIGGRFDSTNVIDSDVAVITTIEAEHLDMLGPTLRDVAWNKAGIMRAGRPCVALSQQPVVLDVLRVAAATAGTLLSDQSEDWSVMSEAGSLSVTTPSATYRNLAIANPMPSQQINAGAAVVAVELAVGAAGAPMVAQVRAGLLAGTLPGRFEVVAHEPPVVLDVAHTADSIASLGDGVRIAFPGRRPVALLGMLDDKDVDAVAAAVSGWAGSVIATTAPSPRGRSSAEIAVAVRERDVIVLDRPDPDEAWTTAREFADGDGVIVVTGSFTIVAGIRGMLLNRE